MPDLQPFIDRWKASGASEKANFQSFIHELCERLDLPRPDPATDQTARNDYTFERLVTFDEGEGHTSTGFIDLYRRDCFVMEAKQGSDPREKTEAEALGGARYKQKMGTARRGTRGWQQAMISAKNQPFIHELCERLDLPRPDPATDQTARNDYTFERLVTFDEGEGHTSTGFIDLYRRDCFVMEAKQGSDPREKTEAEALGGARYKQKMGTARRGTRGWQQAMISAKNQANRYARALPDDHGWPPFLVVVDVGYCFDLYADFSRQGKHYLPFPDPANYRIFLDDLHDGALCERLRLTCCQPRVPRRAVPILRL